MVQAHRNVWEQTLSLIAATTFQQFEAAVIDPVLTCAERDAYWDRFLLAHDALAALKRR
jgi:Trp operon repressor